MILSLAWIAIALAGNSRIPLAGDPIWSAPLSGFEMPGECETCEGPIAFAVRGGVGWILLRGRLVSTAGAEIALPEPGLDVAAGPEGLWVLTATARYRVEGGALVPEPVNWTGQPLEIAGDGAVMSLDGVGGLPLADDLQSPWGAAHLRILEVSDGRYQASWDGGAPFALPGDDVVDVKPSGLLSDGRVVLALTDSRDRSSEDGVRFIAVSAQGAAGLTEGSWNGETDFAFRRTYAADPADGSIWTLMVVEESLSLRRY